MAAEQTIPVVNLTDFQSTDAAVRERFIAQLGDALKAFGFVAVEGHGVPSALIHDTYEAFEELFAMAEEVKRGYENPATGRQRGYTSFGVEHARDSDKPDLKEFWHIGRQLDASHPLYARMPRNVWPPELPELKEKGLELYAAMDRCAELILEAISVYLGEAPTLLPQMAHDGNSVIRAIHYPVCDGFDEPGTMRAAEHEDINLITLLPEATQSGLEILTRDGEWLVVPSLPGQIIVDTGDMMKRLTNDVMPATTHRVVNPQGEAVDRYSMPFFVHPHPDASLAVLESCVAEGEEPKYEPITADEFLQERLREIGVS